MSDRTNIEWTDSTFNPWMGCTKVSPACDHCYAERDTKRFGRVEWGAGKPRVRTSAANWKLPERWNRGAFVQCARCGSRGEQDALRLELCPASSTQQLHDFHAARRRVFCASLADWLDNEVPTEWLIDLLDLIRRTPNLDWLLLTKRIRNWRKRIEAALDFMRDIEGALNNGEIETLIALEAWLAGNPPANVWIGETVIDQPELDRDLLKLRTVPARVRFLSIEPMLGPVNLFTEATIGSLANAVDVRRIGDSWIDWIIAGGESGPHARPSHPNWYRSLRDQCAAAGVPFLFKQWGEWAPVDPCMPSELQESEELAGKLVDGMHRIGKKAAGRKLDGIEHNRFPAAQP